MSYGRSTCAMCGEQLAEAYSGYRLPPVCVRLMDGGDDVDPTAIAGDVAVELCEECTEIARRMIREYDTSPLPECDVEAVQWSDAGVMQALAGGDSPAAASDGSGVDERTVAEAASAVKAHVDGDDEHIFEHRIDEGYIVLMALEELGIVDHDLLD